MSVSTKKLIYRLVRDYEPDEYGHLMEKYQNDEITMALSRVRSNCIAWIKMSQNESILEWGADYGAITNTLCQKSASVVCFEQDPIKCRVIKERTKSQKNQPQIFSDIDCFRERFKGHPFQSIFLIGALEKASLYFPSHQPEQDLLTFLNQLLEDDGRIILACANKFGLKYWAGSSEENSQRLFEGLEDYPHYPQYNSFTMHSIKKVAESSGLAIQNIWYLYPDYKITLSIFSDDVLPQPSSLYLNDFFWENERAKLFSDQKVLDNIINENLFPIFTNAYLFILKKNNSTSAYPPPDKKQVYVKYSNLRSRKFQIRTDILQGLNGVRTVEKHSLNKAAKPFLMNMANTYEKYHQQLAEENIILNHCKVKEDHLVFDYIEGTSFSEHLNHLLQKQKTNQFIDEVMAFFNHLKAVSFEPFHLTEDFVKVFGEVSFQSEQACALIGNIDLNFDNIFIIDEKFHIIDYEWTFDFPIPLGFILNGSLSIFFNHLKSHLEENAGLKKRILAQLYITDHDVVQYIHMWHAFDNYMMGENQHCIKNFQHTKNIRQLEP